MLRTSKVGAAAVLLFIAVSIYLLATRFNVTTDLGVFMPPGQSVMEQVLMSQLDKGSTSNLVFAGITGGNTEQLAQMNRALAGRLSEHVSFIQVLNGERALSDEDQKWVMDNRYNLTPSALEEKFSSDGLAVALDERLRGLTSPVAALEKKFLARDPTGEIMSLLGNWQGDLSGDEGPAKAHDVWFSEDMQRSVMIIELRTSGLDLAGQEQAVGIIFDTFEEIRTPDAELVLSGPSVFAVETREVISGDVRMLSIVATTLVVLFLLAAFRSVMLLALVLVPLVFGVVAASAVVLLMFGNIHGITLAFGVTLTGVAVDYPIHFFSHLKTGREDAEQSIREIWPTLSLGVISTIVAYAVLVMSEFRGLQQLGVFTVVGLLTAAAVTRWVLPFLVPRQLSVGRGLRGLHGILQTIGGTLSGKGMLSLALIPVALVLVFFSSTELRNLDLDALSPIDQDRRSEDKNLRADLGFWYGGKLVVVTGETSENVLVRSEAMMDDLDRLVNSGVIERYDMAASFIPSRQRQQKQLAAIPDEMKLRKRLNDALETTPFRKDVFEKFIQEAVAAKARPLLTVNNLEDSQMGERLKALLFQRNGLWIAPVLLHGVKNEQALEVLNQKYPESETIYLNIKARATQILADALDRIVPLIGFGVLAIYLLLAVSFRNLLKPLRILFPTLSAVAVTLALLNLAGVSLTLMHLVSLLLIVGLGLDYALFYNRLNHNRDEWYTTFKALWVSSFTTILVFGILFFSHTPPLQAIGLTVGIGAFLCLVFGACWTHSIKAKF